MLFLQFCFLNTFLFVGKGWHYELYSIVHLIGEGCWCTDYILILLLNLFCLILPFMAAIAHPIFTLLLIYSAAALVLSCVSWIFLSWQLNRVVGEKQGLGFLRHQNHKKIKMHTFFFIIEAWIKSIILKTLRRIDWSIISKSPHIHILHHNYYNSQILTQICMWLLTRFNFKKLLQGKRRLFCKTSVYIRKDVGNITSL